MYLEPEHVDTLELLADNLTAIVAVLGAAATVVAYLFHEIRKFRREMDEEWVHRDEYEETKISCRDLKKAVEECESHRMRDEITQLRLKDKIEECHHKQEVLQGQIESLTHLLQRRIHFDSSNDRRRRENDDE